MSFRIPLAKPEIADADRDAVTEVLRTPWLSSGPKVEQFERAVCQYTGTKHAVAVNSGTSALQLAIRVLGIERGAEVVLPSFTFSALLNVLLLEELRPRFVDIDPPTYNCSADAMLAAITPETRLLIAVHTFGFPVDVGAINEGVRACKKEIHIIEDACEALGAEVQGRKAGTLADAGLFAFYPNKQITTGEGGMLVTSDDELARRVALLRNQGRDPGLGWNSHVEVGFSYRLSDMNCALGISQLGRIEEVIVRRQKLAEMYDRQLARIPEVVRPPLMSNVGRMSWFVYPVQLADEFGAIDRDRVCEAMSRRGIATGRYFAPLHRQPVFLSWARTTKSTTEGTEFHRGNDTEGNATDGNAREENAEQRREENAEQRRSDDATGSAMPGLPNTEFVADRVLQLPFFNQLAEAEIREVCTALEQSIHELRRRT
jgi:dTDP-4-amino-4,6-dideoxygalactose transaminase